MAARQTEHCLLLTRGKPIFDPEDATTLIRERAREHSRKPEAFYALVERTCPGAKLELFARERRPGWEPWGAEVDYFPPRARGGGGAGVSDRLLTAAEVADLLAVKESWVREATRDGRLPHLRLGRYRRYRLDGHRALARRRSEPADDWLSRAKKSLE